MRYSDINREERYYCNHFFRLLCHELETGGPGSGLRAVLGSLHFDVPDDPKQLSISEVYTEVAIFRDVFAAESDKDSFLEQLFDDYLPMLVQQYDNKISRPIRPSEVKAQSGMLHPNQYGEAVEKFGTSDDIMFYREFSALFNAKPDFLVIWNRKALWFEAKFWEPFSTSQLQRANNIAQLCSLNLLSEYFHHAEPQVILVGSSKRHKKAQQLNGFKFLSWEDCSRIAQAVLPHGEHSYTTQAFNRMLAM